MLDCIGSGYDSIVCHINKLPECTKFYLGGEKSLDIKTLRRYYEVSNLIRKIIAGSNIGDKVEVLFLDKGKIGIATYLDIYPREIVTANVDFILGEKGYEVYYTVLEIIKNSNLSPHLIKVLLECLSRPNIKKQVSPKEKYIITDLGSSIERFLELTSDIKK